MGIASEPETRGGSAFAWVAGAYIVVIYPAFLAGGEVLDKSQIYLMWGAAALSLIAAGAAPLGRYRYLLPLSWIAISAAIDGLTAAGVFFDRPDQWIPVSFALGVLLPCGLVLLTIGRVVRTRLDAQAGAADVR